MLCAIIILCNFRWPIYHTIVYPIIMSAIFRNGNHSAQFSSPMRARSIIFVRKRFWCRQKAQIQGFRSAPKLFLCVNYRRCSPTIRKCYPNRIFRKICIHDNWVCENAVYLSSDNSKRLRNSFPIAFVTRNSFPVAIPHN